MLPQRLTASSGEQREETEYAQEQPAPHISTSWLAVGKLSTGFHRCVVQTFTFLCGPHLYLSVYLSLSVVASWEGRPHRQASLMPQAHNPKEDHS